MKVKCTGVYIYWELEWQASVKKVEKMSFKNQEVSSGSAVNTAGITEGPAALAVG